MKLTLTYPTFVVDLFANVNMPGTFGVHLFITLH